MDINFCGVHLCNQLDFRFCWGGGTSLIANPLEGSIRGGLVWIVSPILFPVFRVILLPLFIAYALAFPVLRVTSQFMTLPGSLSCFLTDWERAVVLLFIAGKKKRAAVDAWYLFHFSPPLTE